MWQELSHLDNKKEIIDAGIELYHSTFGKKRKAPNDNFDFTYRKIGESFEKIRSDYESSILATIDQDAEKSIPLKNLLKAINGNLELLRLGLTLNSYEMI